MPFAASTYRAPWWLPGAHLQTIYSALVAPKPRVDYRRERWETPDGDFIDLDWTAATRAERAPVVALFHGLEGCSRSHYALALMAALGATGWQGVVAHFRGCSGAPNRRARAYHSGDSAEIDWILRRLRSRGDGAPLYAVGVSLGGNALLKWAGETAGGAAGVVTALAAVSAPMDLRAAGDHLARGFNRVYTRWFLRTLKPKSAAKLARYPGLFDARALAAARTMRAFDDVITAPLHGFRDTDDYWQRASSKPWLRHIEVPTLVLNSLNDPFLPAQVLPNVEEVSEHIVLEYPSQGGHAGFPDLAYPGGGRWLPRRLIGFFEQHSGEI